MISNMTVAVGVADKLTAKTVLVLHTNVATLFADYQLGQIDNRVKQEMTFLHNFMAIYWVFQALKYLPLVLT